MLKSSIAYLFVSLFLFAISFNSIAQIGRSFPSERKELSDPETGVKLVFLTTDKYRDSKIYQTHNQWTSDLNWLIFRSDRVRGEAFAVNEIDGRIIQVTEGGYSGMLCVSRKEMKLFYMHHPNRKENFRDLSAEIRVVDLEKLFADCEKGKLKDSKKYQSTIGTIGADFGAHGDMALDASENWIWFRTGKEIASKYLPDSMKIEPNFGPRNMGAGPGGIAGMNIKTGEVKYLTSVPFQIGHLQTNPWVDDQIIFSWETGGKAPQRTWIVNTDGTGLRPLYPESKYEWVTHEAVISEDEVAFAIMGHREIPNGTVEVAEGTDVKGVNPGQEKSWGPCGTREKPTGLGVVNINSRAMLIEGQIPYGSGFWHVSGSPDKKFLIGDNFKRELYLINRETSEMVLLSAGHKATADDHTHPTFCPDGSRIEIQSAMLSEDDKTMGICIVYLPEEMLK